MTPDPDAVPNKAGCSAPELGHEISERLGSIDYDLERRRHRRTCLACQVELLLFASAEAQPVDHATVARFRKRVLGSG